LQKEKNVPLSWKCRKPKYDYSVSRESELLRDR